VEQFDEQITNDIVMLSLSKDPEQLERLCTRIF